VRFQRGQVCGGQRHDFSLALCTVVPPFARRRPRRSEPEEGARRAEPRDLYVQLVSVTARFDGLDHGGQERALAGTPGLTVPAERDGLTVVVEDGVLGRVCRHELLGAPIWTADVKDAVGLYL